MTRAARSFPLLLLIQWHVLREVLLAFLAAFVGVTGTILLGAAVVFLRRFQQVSLGDLLLFFPVLGAYFAVYTMPLSLLFAVIWTFSRVQLDNEITALRSCGVHLHTITVPVVFLAVLISGAMLLLFDQVIPQAHYEKTALLRRTLRASLERTTGGDAIRLDVGRYEILIRDLSSDGHYFEDIVVYELRSRQLQPLHRIVARRGQVIIDEEGGAVVLRLQDVTDLWFEEEGSPVGQRSFATYRHPIPLEDEEVSRARELLAQPASAPAEVRFAAATLRIKGGEPDGVLQGVEVEAVLPQERYSCDEVLVAVEPHAHREGGRMLVVLQDEASARAWSRGEWGHAFERRMERSLHPEDLDRWVEMIARSTPGDVLDLDAGGVRLQGQVEACPGPGQLLMVEARVALARPPLLVQAPQARATLELDSRETPALVLELENGLARGRGGWGGSPRRIRSEELDLPLSLDLFQKGVRKGLSDLSFAELYELYLEPPELRSGSSKFRDDSRLLTEIHYRYALSFAPLVFVLVGIPGALLWRVQSRVASFGITLCKVFILYFPSVIGTRALCASGHLDGAPEWIPVVLWSGNILFSVLGGAYFFRVHRA